MAVISSGILSVFCKITIHTKFSRAASACLLVQLTLFYSDLVSLLTASIERSVPWRPYLLQCLTCLLERNGGIFSCFEIEGICVYHLKGHANTGRICPQQYECVFEVCIALCTTIFRLFSTPQSYVQLFTMNKVFI